MAKQSGCSSTLLLILLVIGGLVVLASYIMPSPERTKVTLGDVAAAQDIQKKKAEAAQAALESKKALQKATAEVHSKEIAQFREEVAEFENAVPVIADLASKPSGPPWRLTITVNENWDALPPKTQLEYAKTFRGAWKGVMPPEPGGARVVITIKNKVGKTVGEYTWPEPLSPEEAQALLKKHQDAYVAILKASGVTVVRRFESEYKKDIWTVRLTVDNTWHYRIYQVRLQDAQTLWEAWARLVSPADPDRARISIVDLRGSEVGGYNLLTGVWVQEK